MPRRTLPIKQLPSGRRQVRYRDTEGRQRSATFDTDREARAFLNRTRADQQRGTWIDPKDGSTTFADYARAWMAAQPWAPATRAAVRNSLEVHLIPAIGDLPLSQVRPTRLQGVVTALTVGHVPGYVGLIVQHLKQVFNAAVQDRIILASPAAGLKLPRAEGRELVIPSVDEVQIILEAIDPRHRALVVLGAGSGLRQGEAFGLSLDRVDFMRRQVTIDRQLVLQGSVSLAPPKTTRSVRKVPLSDSVLLEVARHIEMWPSEDPDGLLFQTKQRTRLRRSDWNGRVWKPAARAANRPELTFRALRHFYASALIRHGHDAVVVARRLGNTPQMVYSTYAHLWRDDDDRTRDAIGEVLAPVVHGLCTAQQG